MRLRDVLRQNRAEILRRFEEQVRRSDLLTAGSSRPLLLDGLPIFLDRVVESLQQGLPTLSVEAQSAGDEQAAEHGELRFEQGYDLQELVREYAILRDVIVGLFSEQRLPIDLEEYRIFSRHLSLGVAEAAKHFSAFHENALLRRSSEHVAFLAHELRSPLCAALLLAQGLRDPSGEGFAERVRDLVASLVRASQLLDEAIVAERVKGSGQLVLASIAEIEIDHLVTECLEHLRTQANSRGVGFHFEPGGAVVRGDRRLLASAVSNLVRNAIKFTRVPSSVLVQVRSEEARVLVDVEDRCGGLPQGVLDKIFEPFEQAGSDRTGFGLGLAIAKQAAEAHGGTITVLDLPGHGCRFTLDVPSARSGKIDRGSEASRDAHPSTGRTG
jgi:signal transduction histidine kinase